MFLPFQTPAETPCLQHGQNIHDSEADRPYTGPANDGRPFNNTQDSSMQPIMDRFEILQLGTESWCMYSGVPRSEITLKSQFKSGYKHSLLELQLYQDILWIIAKSEDHNKSLCSLKLIFFILQKIFKKRSNSQMFESYCI